MDTRKPVDSLAIGIMVVLCLIWALQQIVVKAVSPDMAPVLQIGIRSAVSAVLVALLMAWKRQRLTWRDGVWKPGLLVGLLFGTEFWLVGEGLRHTSASHMVVFLYTSPIFAALGLHWRLPAERLHPAQWVGIGLAFLGVALTFMGREPASGAPTTSLLGDFLGLLAGAAWGATTVAVRCSRLSSLQASETLLYQLLGAAVLLFGAAGWMGLTQFNPTPALIWSLVFQSVVVSFASFLAWFWLLRRYLASRLGVFSFMTPLFGMVLGVVLLNEPLEASFVRGAVLVLAGIVLVSRHEWLTALLTRQRSPGTGN